MSIRVNFQRFLKFEFEFCLFFLFYFIDELDQLQQNISNVAVASGTSIDDFATEYKKLENKLKDLKQILEAKDSDSDVKKLREQLAHIQ